MASRHIAVVELAGKGLVNRRAAGATGRILCKIAKPVMSGTWKLCSGMLREAENLSQ